MYLVNWYEPYLFPLFIYLYIFVHFSCGMFHIVYGDPLLRKFIFSLWHMLQIFSICLLTWYIFSAEMEKYFVIKFINLLQILGFVS